MRVGLSVYGTAFKMGINPKGGRSRVTPLELIDHAHELGLEGVEIPTDIMGDNKPADIVRSAKEKNMFVRVETAVIDHKELCKELHLAAELGSPTLRTFIGGAKLGGDRRHLAGQWPEFMANVHKQLELTMDTAKSLGVSLILENHQDATSEELLELCEKFGPEHFGVVLDTANAMATVEEPIAFAEKLAIYLKHIHLKDYMLYFSEEGYRLVRCPIGQGFMDFPALFEILHKHNPDITMAIEMGALEARHVRMLSDDFWPDYPRRSAAELAKVMNFALKVAKPPGDWRTPYELGESPEAVIAFEEGQLYSSIAYLQQALRKYK